MSYTFFPASEESPRGSSTPIVLLHGFVSSQNYWRRVIPFLTQNGHPVVAIDLLGFGSARHLHAREYDYDAHIHHIEDCLESASITSPFILVGHSMGALLAARYASEHRTHVVKLVLFHPPFYTDREQALATLRATGRLYRFLLTSRFRRVAWGALKFLPTGVAKHSGHGREGSLDNVILAEEGHIKLASLPIDALLVMGAYDRQVYQDNLRSTKTSPFVQVKIIDTGHHSPLTKPKFVSELIQNFIGTSTK